jgi:hypothetical protein
MTAPIEAKRPQLRYRHHVCSNSAWLLLSSNRKQSRFNNQPLSADSWSVFSHLSTHNFKKVKENLKAEVLETATCYYGQHGRDAPGFSKPHQARVKKGKKAQV